MKLRRINALDFYKEFEPCKSYPMERIERIWSGRELTALDILGLGHLPTDDIIWGATRLIDDKANLLLTADFADRMLRAVGITSQGDLAAKYLAVLRQFAVGEATHKELLAANDAAYYTARDASCRAAYRAAYRAANDAAYYTARDASCRAAYRAANDTPYYTAHHDAYYTAYNAARHTEQEWQVARMKEVLNDC